MYKGNLKFKNARTSPYDDTKSRDTTSSWRYTRTSKSQTEHAQSQKLASFQL